MSDKRRQADRPTSERENRTQRKSARRRGWFASVVRKSRTLWAGGNDPVQIPQAHTIQSADPARDLDAIVPLVDAYRVFYGAQSDEAAARAFVQQRFANGDTQFFVARANDGLLGFAHLLLSLDTVALKSIGILEDIYVVDTARGAGIGGALLDAAERYARERGLARLTLSTAHKNRTAQRLYLAHGYVPDQRFRSFNRFLSDDDPR